jgi:hypothetical protein
VFVFLEVGGVQLLLWTARSFADRLQRLQKVGGQGVPAGSGGGTHASG